MKTCDLCEYCADILYKSLLIIKMPSHLTRASSEAIRMEPLGRTSSSRSPGQNGITNTEIPETSGEFEYKKKKNKKKL